MARYTKTSKGFYRTGVCTGEYTATGNPKRKYVTARTITELEEKVAKVRQDIKQQRNVFDESTTFEKYAMKWYEVYKANKGARTREMYLRIITSRFKPLFRLKMVEISQLTIQSLINENKEHPRTCEQMLLTLKQIFETAVDNDLITKSPVKDIELPRHTPKERRALTKAELDAVKAAELTPRERAFVSLLLGCGLRPAEAYALTWSDIDFPGQCININKSLVFVKGHAEVDRPKTDNGIRLVEAPQFVLSALKDFRVHSSTLILFGGKTGKYRDKSRYSDEWQAIKKKIEAVLGCETELTPYYFRHNYASLLYYSGISLLEAKRLMGHSDTKMIMEVYAHLDSKKENTLQKLNKIAF